VLQLAQECSLGTDCHQFSVPLASPQLHLPGEAAGQAGPRPAPTAQSWAVSSSSVPDLCGADVQRPL